MKQVITEYSEPDLISIKEMYEQYTSDNIIAYVTSGGKGLAVLRQSSDSCYGFTYHKDLVTNRNGLTLRFSDGRKTEAIKKAVKAGRKVLLFNDFSEFLQYAAKISCNY